MGIIQQLSEHTEAETYLVLGINGSGRTTQAFELVKDNERVLYIGFTNLGFKNFDVPETWDSALISDWATFDSEILTAARSGKLDYDAIVIDDFDIASEYVLAMKASIAINDYAVVANKLGTAITVLKSAAKVRLVTTLTVVDTELAAEAIGKKKPTDRKIALNPATRNRLIGKCSHRWYTFVTKDMNYEVQKNPLLAVKLSTKLGDK